MAIHALTLITRERIGSFVLLASWAFVVVATHSSLHT